MNCGQSEPLLTRYLLGDLDEPTRAAVESHLAGCASCRAEADALRPTVDLLKGTLGNPLAPGHRLDPERRQRLLRTASQVFARRGAEPVTIPAATLTRSAPKTQRGVSAPADSGKPAWITALPLRQIIEAAAIVMVLLTMAGLLMPALSLSREKARKASGYDHARPALTASPVVLDYQVERRGKEETDRYSGGFAQEKLNAPMTVNREAGADEQRFGVDLPEDRSGPRWNRETSQPDAPARPAEASTVAGPERLGERIDSTLDAKDIAERLRTKSLVAKSATLKQPVSLTDGDADTRIVAGVTTGAGRDSWLASDEAQQSGQGVQGEPASGGSGSASTFGRQAGQKSKERREDYAGAPASEPLPEVATTPVPSAPPPSLSSVIKSPVIMRGLAGDRARAGGTVGALTVGGLADSALDQGEAKKVGRESGETRGAGKPVSVESPKLAASAPTKSARLADGRLGLSDAERTKKDALVAVKAGEESARFAYALAASDGVDVSVTESTSGKEQDAVLGDKLSDLEGSARRAEAVPLIFNNRVDTRENPFSTFAIDVDTAAFALARRALLGGRLPAPESVRVEEFVNAFEYAYPSPERRMFAVYTDRARSPFRPNLELLRIGVRGKVLGRDRQRSSVLTFVVDTSGSMNTPDRLELIQQSLKLLVDQLSPKDTVSIVTFGSEARLILDQTPASARKTIGDCIESIQASGSTHLESGLRLGYETASRHFRSSAVNRVLLLSDGVANLGAGTAEEILSRVDLYRKQGIFCSVFGFGQGLYDDAMLERLADRGDGVYTFVDSLAEAKRVLVDELAATLYVIARDVKIQVEFDPARVKSYRQLGYENRRLEKEQFRDDTVDAGEVGSGQSVTALYELDVTGNPADPLGMVRVRWKDQETGRVEELAQPLRATDQYTAFQTAPVRFRLAAGAVELADLLRGNPATAGTDLETVLSVLRPVGLELHLDRQVQDLVRMANEAGRLRQ
jgi:Ca-activated chloride channel family protein